MFVSHLKDVFLWINESEHLRLGIVQKDGNIKTAFQRLALNVENILPFFKIQEDPDNLGYLTMSPALIGSGLKIYAHIRLPYLGLEENFRNELIDQHGLDCVKSKQFTLSDNLFVLTNKRTYGLTESEILSSVYLGVREIITIENKFKNSAKNVENDEEANEENE